MPDARPGAMSDTNDHGLLDVAQPTPTSGSTATSCCTTGAAPNATASTTSRATPNAKAMPSTIANVAPHSRVIIALSAAMYGSVVALSTATSTA